MNRDEAREQLSAYLDGELDAGTRSALEAKLAEDGDLRAELDALRHTVALVQSLPNVSAPAGLSDRVIDAIEAPSRQSSWVRQWVPVALAAAACAAIGLVAVLDRTRPEPAPAARHLALDDDTESARATRVEEEKVVDAFDAVDGTEDAPVAELDQAEAKLDSRARAELPATAAAPTPGPPSRAMKSKRAGRGGPAPMATPGSIVHASRGAKAEGQWAEDDLLIEDIRRSGGRSGLYKKAADDSTAVGGNVLRAVRRYDDLDACLRDARRVLERSGATYVVQPVGSGRFTIEATLPQATAHAVLAGLRLAPGMAGTAMKRGETRKDAATPAPDPVGTQAAVVQRPVPKPKGRDQGALVHLVVHFEKLTEASERPVAP